jgi:hypothetical protein
MLMSGDRAARSALLMAGLRLGATPADRALAGRERSLLDNDGGVSQPLVLIVGGSRSGTTLLYQLLASTLDVSYFTNLSAAFPHAPITVQRKLGARERRPDFESYYGQTAGMSGANDGFHVWNRWFGDDRYVVPTEFAPAAVDEMRRFFAAWTSVFPKPLVNKNNRNSLSVPLLAEALPTAKFLAIFRDPFYVARSLIRAREVVHGDKRMGWGVGAGGGSRPGPDGLGYVDDVVDQVWRAEVRLKGDLASLDSSRARSLTYERLCAEPAAIVHEVSEWVPAPVLRADVEPFEMSFSEPLSEEEERRLADGVKARFG